MRELQRVGEGLFDVVVRDMLHGPNPRTYADCTMRVTFPANMVGKAI